MTLRFIQLALVGSGILFSVCDPVIAQQISIGGGSGSTSGMGSGRTTGSGSSTSGGTTSSSSTTGSRSTTAGSSSSRTTSSSATTSGSGSTGTGESAVATNFQNSAQSFVGGNLLDTFVGGGLESGANTNRNRQFRGIMESGTEGFSQTQQQSGTPRSRRVSLRIGFPVASASASAGQLSPENAVSLQSFLFVRPDFGNMSVSMTSDGRVTLGGTAATSESRRLAANLMRLQPGVRRVDNQIVVTGN